MYYVITIMYYVVTGNAALEIKLQLTGPAGKTFPARPTGRWDDRHPLCGWGPRVYLRQMLKIYDLISGMASNHLTIQLTRAGQTPSKG
jgi:hypothetical protein